MDPFIHPSRPADQPSYMSRLIIHLICLTGRPLAVSLLRQTRGRGGICQCSFDLDLALGNVGVYFGSRRINSIAEEPVRSAGSALLGSGRHCGAE